MRENATVKLFGKPRNVAAVISLKESKRAGCTVRNRVLATNRTAEASRREDDNRRERNERVSVKRHTRTAQRAGVQAEPQAAA